MPSKLGTKHDVCGQVVNTVACTVKIKIPDTLAHRLDEPPAGCLVLMSRKRMLRNRDEASSKYYPEIPSVVSKSLIAKYQRNAKCKSVSKLVIPICGDKETADQSRGPSESAFQRYSRKKILPLIFAHPCIADELGRRNVSAEFFMRGGEWY
jgi:hypothetical protein